MNLKKKDKLVGLYHTEAVELIKGKDHISFFATSPARQLIIFVHGFNGTSLSTWNYFLYLIRKDSAFCDTDVVFYGYDSLKYQAADHAGDFYDFLKDHALSNAYTSSLVRILEKKSLPERNYLSVKIVAHSLGAIVVREALKTGYDNKQRWLNKIRMILFAPAHHGAHIKRLIFHTLDIFTLTKLIGSYAQYKMPVLNDLEAGSAILKKIMDDTKTLLSMNEGDFTKAHEVVHAKGDKIVTNLKFNGDNDAKRIEGKTHSSVCKPNDEYKIPIELLKQI